MIIGNSHINLQLIELPIQLGDEGDQIRRIRKEDLLLFQNKRDSRTNSLKRDDILKHYLGPTINVDPFVGITKVKHVNHK